jgi:hypothetical protein
MVIHYPRPKELFEGKVGRIIRPSRHSFDMAMALLKQPGLFNKDKGEFLYAYYEIYPRPGIYASLEDRESPKDSFVALHLPGETTFLSEYGGVYATLYSFFTLFALSTNEHAEAVEHSQQCSQKAHTE